MIVEPQNPFRYLEIRGRVVEIEPDPEQRLINALAQKYLREPVYPWHNPQDERVVMVEPERVSP